MDNKGFGLPELLVFIGCSIFILIGFMLYWNNSKEEIESVDNFADPIITPAKVEIPKEYKKLEEKLQKAAYNYKFDKKENIIISLNKLKKAKLINNLNDPNDSNILCNGYVIYNSNIKSYTSYINCPGMYVTKDFNSDFE